MPNPKAYNHGDKAGNAGDVWKHFILLAVIEAMLKNPGRSRASAPFVYVDTHAATGRYSLRPNGAWQRGVGAIRPQLQHFPDWAYFRLLSQFGPDMYPGSWLLVGNYLHSQGVPFEMHLAEDNESVSQELRSVSRSLPFCPNITSYCENGFELPGRLPHADLILVDPPYGSNSRDWDAVVESLPELRRAAAFLVWYPIANRRFKPDKLLRMTSLTGHEIHWLPLNPGGNLKGCGIIAGGEAAAILDQLHSELDGLSTLIPWHGDSGTHAEVYHLRRERH